MKKRSLKATGHRILVRPKQIDKEYKTESGFTLYMPDQSVDMERAAVDEGTVIDIGPTAFKDLGNGDPWVSVGDRVVWPRYAGRFWPNNENPEYYILNDEDILAVIQDA